MAAPSRGIRSIARLSSLAIAKTAYHPSHGVRRIVTTNRPVQISSVTSLVPQRRWQSTAPAAEDWKMWNFDTVKEVVNSPESKVKIIDVREPGEYSAGHIPKANNMPITSSPDALFLPADEFEERFGFEKPKHDTEVVFYCKAGIRSKASATLARQAGFENVGEYRGSWLDWSDKGGPSG